MLIERCPWYIAGPILGAASLFAGVILQRVLAGTATVVSKTPATAPAGV